jgi:8-amino-7-oxononanoate synthase
LFSRVSFYSEITRSLHSLEADGLRRFPLSISGPQQPELIVNGRSVLCFSSNNYLGLANHPRIVSAAVDALHSFGFGSASSRLISGTMDLHRLAENRISSYLGIERSLLFSSGYAANVGTIQSLVDSSDVIFSDSLNHASIIDGCRLSRARVFIYDHLDIDHLRSLLSKNRSLGRKSLVITEAVFSMDGDFSPLKELRLLCNDFDSALMVDEAHSLGVFGDRGIGLSLSQSVLADVFIGTFGKAFGAVGAFVASSSDVVQFIENRARSFVFSTSPPVSFAAAIIASIDLVEIADDLRLRLLELSSRLRAALSEMGYRVLPGSSPIIPLLFGNPERVVAFSSSLLDRGLLVQGIRPPTVPPGSSRLRVIPIATHTDAHIDTLIESFRELSPHYRS